VCRDLRAHYPRAENRCLANLQFHQKPCAY
jgi:hypothetical protein